MPLPFARPHSRRTFLADLGMGCTGLALGDLLLHDGIARAATGDSPAAAVVPHFAPKAKSVIWLFMVGGASQMETFDPKPELNKYAGKTIEETPYKAALASPYLKNNRELVEGLHNDPSQACIRCRSAIASAARCGVEMSDWWPHLGECADDIAFVRSMLTTDNDHGAQLQFHTGRHTLEGQFPDHRLVGPLRARFAQRQPAAVRRAGHADCRLLRRRECARRRLSRPRAQRRAIGDRSQEPPALRRSRSRRVSRRASSRVRFAGPAQPACGRRVSGRCHDSRPDQKSTNWHSACSRPSRKSCSSIPAKRQPRSISTVSTATRRGTFGRQCLAARRLVERGVRFVQVFHGSNGGAGDWDAHGGLRVGHSRLCCRSTSRSPALLKDLKQRGLLDETLVVWGTEFGRTPGAQNSDGRDHHPYGFSVWLAGGGIKGGVVHGATDELGFHAVENRHYVTDVHATVLNNSASTPTASKSPAANGSKSTSANRSTQSSREAAIPLPLREGLGEGQTVKRSPPRPNV